MFPPIESIRKAFQAKQAEGATALVTFITAGFPHKDATVPLMLAMQAGGADIIELGKYRRIKQQYEL
ncbi:hypothetical protein AX14_009817 [Amanita brunnescens Koide BX004]|nr:hypothetical protein AX14_009817 [Amanita brunnescens Koide BX004]